MEEKLLVLMRIAGVVGAPSLPGRPWGPLRRRETSSSIIYDLSALRQT